MLCLSVGKSGQDTVAMKSRTAQIIQVIYHTTSFYVRYIICPRGTTPIDSISKRY